MGYLRIKIADFDDEMFEFIIKNMEETIDGDKAKVKVNYKASYTDTFTLVKINGEWKVSIDMGK